MTTTETGARGADDPSAEATKRALEVAMAGHQPKTDGPFSLNTHTFCSCGEYEVYMALDGYPASRPATYPCQRLRAIQSALHE